MVEMEARRYLDQSKQQVEEEEAILLTIPLEMVEMEGQVRLHFVVPEMLDTTHRCYLRLQQIHSKLEEMEADLGEELAQEQRQEPQRYRMVAEAAPVEELLVSRSPQCLHIMEDSEAEKENI